MEEDPRIELTSKFDFGSELISMFWLVLVLTINNLAHDGPKFLNQKFLSPEH